jgi:1-acyl-sn-glycerol-3-phosphate acyltransferase
VSVHWLYWIVRGAARGLLPILGAVEVRHLERLPRKGGVLLLPNHQSALDPFLVQGWSPRPVRSMTKSTQFGSDAMQWVLPRLGAFPVRRYRTDAQTVRSALRFLKQGEVVCIYPEGERSWDGSVGPFRRGTLRLAAFAIAEGIPVLPVRISGMYDAFPRWGRPRRISHRLELEFCSALNTNLAIAPIRAARDAALPELEARLRGALSTGDSAAGEAG